MNNQTNETRSKVAVTYIQVNTRPVINAMLAIATTYFYCSQHLTAASLIGAYLICSVLFGKSETLMQRMSVEEGK